MSAADEPPRARRQLFASTIIAVAVAVAVALVASSLHRSVDAASRASPEPLAPRAASYPTSPRAELARAALQRQREAVRSRSRKAYLRTWSSSTPTATRRGSTVFANLQTLDAVITHIGYVEPTPLPGAAAVRRRLSAGAWTADVELGWRLRAYDERPAEAVLTFTFVRRGYAAYVADIAPTAGERRPVWLLGRLDVRRTRRTLAAASTGSAAGRLHKLLALAVTDVGRAVPNWRGELVAYEPATVRDFESLLAATPGAYDGVAAVTASVDGSTSPRAPIAIFLNPAVFDGLAKVGAHVVISHESAHAATGAAAVGLPLWVAEGFADYVGVGSVDVPLAVSAGAAIRDVRRHGLPPSLPSNAMFGAAGDHLEVYYEQSWLAARLIAREYGRARLLSFYQRVVAAAGGVARALRTELDTSQAQLTSQWRAYLGTLAGAA